MRRALAVLLAMMPLAAHHSPAAEYDLSKVVALEGVITQVRWSNPHASFLMDVTDAAGKVSVWEVEIGSPNGLMRGGWKRDDLKTGDEVKVDVWRAKNGSQLGDAKTVTLPDGRTFTANPMWVGGPVIKQ